MDLYKGKYQRRKPKNYIKVLHCINRKYFAKMKYPYFLESLPVDENTVLLESQHGKDVDGNIFYLAKTLLSDRAYKDFTIYITARDRKVAKKIRKRFADIDSGRLTVLIFQTKEYYRTVATAKYLINDNTFLDFFIKRDEQIYINVWHGTPLKHLGKKDKHLPHAIGNAQKNFFVADFLLYPNKYTMDHMIEDYMIANLSRAKIILGGYPRNEAFFDEASRNSIRKEVLGADKKHIYAYMPTWRSDKYSHNMIKEKLEDIDELLNDNEEMYVKLHAVHRYNIDFDKFDNIRPFPSEYETYAFLNAADCLVTDYSSVLFDYSITGRRTVLFTFDEEEYSEKRGMYTDPKELPFKRTSDALELLAYMRMPEVYGYDEIKNKFCLYDNPNASKKLLERVILNKKGEFTELEMPSNGRENIIIYAGNISRNGITASLFRLLEKSDKEKFNYYIAFSSNLAAYYKENLSNIPKGVNYISYVGKMNAAFKEKIAIIAYGQKMISFERFWNTAKKAYVRDYKRLYGNNSFRASIQFSGYEYKRILAFMLHRSKRIIYVHNDMKQEIATRANQRREVIDLAYSSYDALVAVSEDVRDSTAEMRGTDDKITVINNVIDAAEIRKKAEEAPAYLKTTIANKSIDELKCILKDGGKKFVNVARFSPEKGHDRLVCAFDRYWDEHKNDYLIIIGGNQWRGMYYYLRDEIVETLRARDNIILILDIDNPFAIMKQCDGFIFSSHYEGFGMAIMEADILGLPVASTDVTGPGKFLRKYGGHLVENTEEGILEGIEWLSENPMNLTKFNYDEYNKKNIKLFESLLD